MKECPLCKGRGKLKMPFRYKVDRVAMNKVMAKLLRKEGYSIRQIMKYLKYKSTQSVVMLLK